MATRLGKPGSRAQHFFGYTATLDSCGDLQLNLLWLQNGSIPCTMFVDVRVNSTKPLCVSCYQPHANPSAKCWLHTAVLWQQRSGTCSTTREHRCKKWLLLCWPSAMLLQKEEKKKKPSFFSLIDFVSENIMLLFSYQLLKSLELLRL